MIAEAPLQLMLRPAPATVDAFLLIGEGGIALAAACARSQSRQLPAIHRVRGGFLLVPSEAGLEPLAAIRLRRLGGDLFIPAHTDLSPALLPDEIIALTRQQGLVVLPGSVMLAFDPKSLAVNEWLAPPQIVRRTWRPFPPRSARPEKLTLIEHPSDTPAAVIESLTAGAPDDAAPLEGNGESPSAVPEDARPPAGSLGQRIAAGMTLAAAKVLAATGMILQAPGLAKLGGKLARKAVEKVPRLSEKILGAQEAALRNILQQLHSGKIEEALRRAPVAVPDPEKRGIVDTTANLKPKNPSYLLRNLLGHGSDGPGPIWLGGGDVWIQLANEYRRLAQEAFQRGDFRRAAYLYGVLLRDLRSAANALASGGLHRDAAVLFRDKLNDPLAAAQQFERAGDIDEAARLYERLEKYEAAAELLRRAGDEDRANDYFLRAAEQHCGAKRWLAAGDLVRTKLGRRDLARNYFHRGWESEGSEMAVCGQRLLDEHIATEEWDAIHAMILLASQERFLPPRSTDAGRFFNHALKQRESLPMPLAENLRDTARSLFADHLRSSPKGQHLAGQLFGSGNPWPPEVARDAIYATRKAAPRMEEAIPHEPPVKAVEGTVVAAIAARVSRDLIIATTTRVICWRAMDGTQQPIFNTGKNRRVLGLATDDNATVAYVLYGEGSDLFLRCISLGSRGQFEPDGQVKFENVPGSGSNWYLKPTARSVLNANPCVVTLFTDTGCRTFSGSSLLELGSAKFEFTSPVYLMVNDSASKGDWLWDRHQFQFIRYADDSQVTVSSPWTPAIPVKSCLTVPHVDWIAGDHALLIAGVDVRGHVHAKSFVPREAMQNAPASTSKAGYLAACLGGSNQVVAVNADNEIHWLGYERGRLLVPVAIAKIKEPQAAVFLAANPLGKEVLAVLADGSVVRVPRPR